MAAGVLDLLIEQGSTFTRTVTVTGPVPNLTPVDLTGYTARGQIRETAQSATIVVSFTCVVSDPTNGVITVSLTDEQTSAIPATGAKYSNYQTYYYDIEIESAGGIVTRLLNGKVSVSPEVTK